MNITELSTLIEKRELSPVDLVKESLEKIFEENKKNNSFITISDEEALQAARMLEKELVEGKVRSKLHGIPIAIKDLIYTKDIRTTMGSKVYENFVPEVDATVIKKLKQAGAIIIGKTNTHEFAYGPIGDRSYFGPCLNPYNLKKISGGSSSGSAAAVGAGMVSLALGTDTGGSIRIPSSACGIVGMKPTFGLVSKKGVYDLAYTLDHVGPMTNNVYDNALLLNIIAGYDSSDPYSINTQITDYRSLIGKDIKGKVIGIPSFYFELIDEEVQETMNNSIIAFENLGARIKEVNIDCINNIAVAQAVTIKSEAAAAHMNSFERYKGVIDVEVYERLEESREIKAYEYVQSQIVRKKLISEYNQVFKHVDVLLTPTLPILPTDIGQREVTIGDQNELVRNALLRLTSITNYTGNPSISVPCNLSKSGLPIGSQLIAKHGNETQLYQFAYALEQSLNFTSNKNIKGLTHR